MRRLLVGIALATATTVVAVPDATPVKADHQHCSWWDRVNGACNNFNIPFVGPSGNRVHAYRVVRCDGWPFGQGWCRVP
jgi:hypothetical protein